eukprot:scaffold5941_cov125-Isochrysis_galbana.AAC.5
MAGGRLSPATGCARPSPTCASSARNGRLPSQREGRGGGRGVRSEDPVVHCEYPHASVRYCNPSSSHG